MLGLELPHAVGVQHVVEGDPQQVLPRVAQVTLTAATKKYLKPCLKISGYLLKIFSYPVNNGQSTLNASIQHYLGSWQTNYSSDIVHNLGEIN